MHNKNILKYLNKDKNLLTITDSNKTIYFESIKSQFNKINKSKSWNVDLDTNKVKLVGTELEILKQAGLSVKKIRDFLK